MSPVKFFLSDAVTATFTVALMGGMGYVGGNSIEILKKDLLRIEHVALLVWVILIAGWFVLKYFKEIKR